MHVNSCKFRQEQVNQPPRDDIPKGRYHLISKTQPRADENGGKEPKLFLYRLSHPLGEHVVDSAKVLATPPEEIIFDVTHDPTRLSVIEALRGKKGYLPLSRLTVDSYEREEYLPFSGFEDSSASLDQETMEKLFVCSGRESGNDALPDAVLETLGAEADRHAKATVSRSLEQNSKHFAEAREKIEKWADDMVVSAEKGAH